MSTLLNSYPTVTRCLRNRGWRLAVGAAACILYALFSAASAQAATSAVTWPPIHLRVLESGFTRPIGIVSPNDGTDRLFVIQRNGLIYIIENGERLETPFLDISDRISDVNAPGCGECGLLGLAFPPDFAEAGYFFVNYTSADDRIGPDTGDPDPTDMGDTVIARYHVTDDPNVADNTVEEPILIINQPAKNHNGGQMLFGPDDYLYIATGDGGGSGDEHQNAQNPASLLGKILRIEVGETLTYTVPATNPFTPTVDYRDEIWAEGLRNPWRFHFDRISGDLYIADVGQGDYEEINYVAAADIGNGGMNFGWPIVEGDVCFPPTGGQTCDRTGLTAPVTTYDHSAGDCSVTGGYVYRTANPAQAPVYLYADFCTGRLWGLQPDGATWATTELDDFPFQVTSFGDDAAGNVYIAGYAGTIYILDEEITGLSAANDGPKQVGEAIDFTTTITGGPAITYTWDFGDGQSGNGIAPSHTYTASGVYTASVVAANNINSMTTTTTVYVGDAVVEVINNQYVPRDVFVPPGGKVVWVLRKGNHSVTADNGEFNQPAGTDWPPFIHQFDELPAAAAIDASVVISYHCTVHGASMSGTVTVTDAPPVVGLAATNDGPTILGSPTTFTATISSGTVTTYTWDFGDGSSGSGITATHTYSATGIYTATVIAANAEMSATASTTVTVQNAPSTTPLEGLSASNDGPTELGSPTLLSAELMTGTADAYVWDFGDGSSGNGITTTHSYTATGIFTATVVASNAISTVTGTTIVYVGDAVVEVIDNEYVPRHITVPVGSTVVWVLREGFHSVTADDGSFNQPVGTDWPPFLVRFDTEGLYPYYCTAHGGPGGEGMSGSVRVANVPEEGAEMYFPGIFLNHNN